MSEYEVLHPVLTSGEGNSTSACHGSDYWALSNLEMSRSAFLVYYMLDKSTLCFHSLTMLTTKEHLIWSQSSLESLLCSTRESSTRAVQFQALRSIFSLVQRGCEHLPPRLVGRTEWNNTFKDLTNCLAYSKHIVHLLLLLF